MTDTTTPLTPGNLPRRGQRIIITGTPIAGALPGQGGHGWWATYEGVVNGHATFTGNTSDYTYIDHTRPDHGITWQAR